MPVLRLTMPVFVAAVAVAFLVLPAASALVSRPMEAAVDPAPSAKEHAEWPHAPVLAPFEAKRGPALLRAPAESWVPVFAKTHSMAEASKAAALAVKEYYDVAPLGDADGDGREDYLLTTDRHNLTKIDWDSEEDLPSDVVALSAVSGASHAPIWHRPLPPDGYWYPLGDVDLDGVDDLVVADSKVTSVQEFTYAGAGRFHYVITIDTESQALTGRSGDVLFQRHSQDRIEYTITFVEVVDMAEFSFEFTSFSGADPGRHPGVDITQSAYTARSTFFLAAWLQDQSAVNRIERTDAHGASLWKAEVSMQDRAAEFADWADYTGDGVPDFLFVGEASRSVRTLLGLYADAPPEARPAEVRLVDGANGRTAWDVTSDVFVGEGWALPGGRLANGHASVLLHLFGRDPLEPQGFRTRIATLDGATGQQLESRAFPGELVAAMAFSDIDHDGATELLVVRASYSGLPTDESPSTAQVLVAKRDLAPVWGLKDVPLDALNQLDDPRLLPDLTGDRVAEIPLLKATDGSPYSWESAEADLSWLNGATGASLWSYHLDPRVLSIDFVDDVDGGRGTDLAFTLFDVPLEKAKDSRGARSSSIEDRLDYAMYPGFLELRRGDSGALMWRRQVHDPTTAGNVTDRFPYAWATVVPDIDGNAVPDLLYDVGSGGALLAVCTSESCDVDAYGDDESLLDVTLILEGASGATLRSYPAPSASAPVPAVQVGEAAPRPLQAPTTSGDKGFVPAPAAAWILLGLAGLALVRRRQA